jgi:hypothetical protein
MAKLKVAGTHPSRDTAHLESDLLFLALRDNIEALHRLAFAEDAGDWEEEAALKRMLSAREIVSKMKEEIEECELLLKVVENRVLSV